MAVLAIDLGGTKMAAAVFTKDGHVMQRATHLLEKRTGKAVGAMISDAVRQVLEGTEKIETIGIAVPGISRRQHGTVWAPNIPGWEDYPLLEEVRAVAGEIPIHIESDRSCYILGETWQGNAQGCEDAVYLSVGTGIGAGILSGGHLIRGAADIGGAIGWLALDRPFQSSYISSGCFESQASGEGMAKVALQLLSADADYDGELKKSTVNAADVLEAYSRNDRIAVKVIRQCIELWGMATANLVSLFNPDRIIFGGGVFGPATRFLPDIAAEAAQWAQPISMRQVKLSASGLGNDAGLYGAAYLALQRRFHA